MLLCAFLWVFNLQDRILINARSHLDNMFYLKGTSVRLMQCTGIFIRILLLTYKLPSTKTFLMHTV